MQEQQYNLEAMLAPNGHLVYYGLHLPQQPVNVIGTEGGICSVKDSESPDYILPHEPVLHPPLQSCHQPSSMSQFINYLNVSSTSKNTMSTSVTIAPVASPSPKCNASCSPTCTNASMNNTSSSGASTAVSKDKNVLRTTESGKQNSTSSIMDNVSSSTCKSGADKNDTELHNRKSPAPPTRMVTRSQTAAERMQPINFEEHRDDQSSLRLRSRSSGSDADDEYGPHKVKREMSSNFYDDFSYTKNPAGAGIEFGAVCADCGAVAVTGVGWNAHQQAHRNENAACKYCSQVFLTDYGKQIHQQLHRDGHTREVDDFCECGICGGSFISILYLELHLLELHGRDALGDQRALHLGPTSNSDQSCSPEDESGQQLFQCGVCRSLFTYSLNLDCHMALHSEVSYCCAICDAAFPTLDPLVAHSKCHRLIGHESAQSVPLSTSMPTRTPQYPLLQTATNSTYNSWKATPVRNAFHSRPVPQYVNQSAVLGASTSSQASNPKTSKVVPQPAISRSATMPPPVQTMTTAVTPPVTPTVIPSMAPIVSPPLIPTMSPMMTPPMAPVMTAPMTPAMLNYYMMMTLWGNNKTSGNQSNFPAWQNYLNPAMANAFSYFNPYLLNNSNLMGNSSGNNETESTPQQTSCCKQDVDKQSDAQNNRLLSNTDDDCGVKDSTS